MERRVVCCQSSQQVSCRLKSKDMLATLCLHVGLMRDFLTACTEEVAPLCDLWVAEVLLFSLAFPLLFLGGQNLAPACPGLASCLWQIRVTGGFPAEALGLMSCLVYCGRSSA